MQLAFYLGGEITQVKESISWVRYASANVLPESGHDESHNGRTIHNSGDLWEPIGRIAEGAVFFQHRNKILVCYESVSIARAGWVGGGERESKYLLLRGNRTPQHPLHSRAKCKPDPNYQNKSFLASSSLRRRLRSARPSSTSRSISPRIRGLSRNRVTDAAIFLRAPWNTHF